MLAWRGLESIPSNWGRCIATIGVFDGMHRGHQRIIARSVELGAATGLPVVLITFTPHPSEVIRPGSHPAVLTSNIRKAELAGQLGVDVVLFIPFTQEFSRLSPAEFAHEALVADLHSATVVVGENFRFGHQATGDIQVLQALGQQWGFAAEAVPLLCEDQRTISSTYIRSCVAAGDVAAAACALGRAHRVDGIVERGDQRGRGLGFPTANLQTLPHVAVPADGIYAGLVTLLGLDGQTPTTASELLTAVSVGSNPTFDGQHRSVEAYILDFRDDIYGQRIGIEFRSRLREMTRFDSVEDLIAQMHRDVEQTRELLS